MTDGTTRFRRLGSAACMIAAPLLLLAATAVAPWNVSGSMREMLDVLAANQTGQQIGDVLALAATLAFIPATLAVMRAVRAGAPVLGLAGGILAVAGWAAGAGLVGVDTMTVGMARQSGALDAMAAAWEDQSWVIAVVFGTFLLGHAIGMILLGVAMIRSRVAPAWAGAVVIAAIPVEIAAYAIGDQRGVALGAYALMAVGLGALALRVATADDAEWERGDLAVEPADRAAVTV